MVARESVGEGIVREFGIDMNTLLCLKWITSTGNSAQCYVQREWEGSLGENGSIYMAGRVPWLAI